MNERYETVHEDNNSDSESEDEEDKNIKNKWRENEYLFNSIYIMHKIFKNRNLFDRTNIFLKQKHIQLIKKYVGKNYIVYKGINIIIEIFKSNIPLSLIQQNIIII